MKRTAGAMPVEALSWEERFRNLDPEDQDTVLAKIDRLMAKRAAATGETPIMVLFREWLSLWDVTGEAGRQVVDGQMTEDEYDVLAERMVSLEQQMMALPKANLVDVLAAFAAASNLGDVIYGDGFWNTLQAEAHALVEGLA